MERRRKLPFRVVKGLFSFWLASSLLVFLYFEYDYTIKSEEFERKVETLPPCKDLGDLNKITIQDLIMSDGGQSTNASNTILVGTFRLSSDCIINVDEHGEITFDQDISYDDFVFINGRDIALIYTISSALGVILVGYLVYSVRKEAFLRIEEEENEDTNLR